MPHIHVEFSMLFLNQLTIWKWVVVVVRSKDRNRTKFQNIKQADTFPLRPGKKRFSNVCSFFVPCVLDNVSDISQSDKVRSPLMDTLYLLLRKTFLRVCRCVPGIGQYKAFPKHVHIAIQITTSQIDISSSVLPHSRCRSNGIQCSSLQRAFGRARPFVSK